MFQGSPPASSNRKKALVHKLVPKRRPISYKPLPLSNLTTIINVPVNSEVRLYGRLGLKYLSEMQLRRAANAHESGAPILGDRQETRREL